ncbi:MAG: HpcH/HpaI aldolase/citrate lyase family protein, partial [Bosea sp. (in: a-proteobacteria)]
LLPKVGSASHIEAARQLAGTTPLWAMIETPAGVLNAAAIAEAIGSTGTLVLGLNDLAKESGMAQARDRAPMTSVLTHVLLAARAHGAAALDGVCNALDDAARFEDECQQGRAFGFDGKTVIHPSQVSVANRVFGPSTAEIAEANAIVAAFSLPDSVGKGVISLGGRMVERLHLMQAEALLAKAAMIATRTRP